VATSIEEDGDVTHEVTSPERASVSPPPPAGIDRYVVLEEVGAGGMGVVHRAYDPKLRREVALKLLRFDRRGGTSAQRAESRILREAQTMARLSHPNVLPVYDVEPVGELVYIAMEYVDGETLGRWLRRTSRTWREVVECFCQAGQGLHAAHQAGIVHRDFKPSNVLLGNKGRVLVTDFGLARAGSDDERVEPLSSGARARRALVTEDGEVVGTPAYMAPEQLRGGPVDARADQYAFCVALYEGLFGRRPFSQREIAALLQAKQAGRIEPVADAGVPGWLFRIVERGMAPLPDQRFASMAELLAALGRDPAQARRRWAWVGTGAVLGAAAIGLRLAADPPGSGCPDADALVEQVWDDAAREQVRAALMATDQSYAADMAERVTTGLDRYARAWAEGHVDACTATRVHGEQSEEAFDLRMACLRRHRAELEATVEVLSERVSVTTLRGAAGLVAALPEPQACADVEALLARRRSTNPTHAAELEALRAELSRARALVRAGRATEARTSIERVEGRATELDDPTVRGEALRLRGVIAIQERDLPTAERWLTEAYVGAVEGRDAPLALEAATDLVDLVGVQLARTAEAELWAVQAHAWLRGGGDPDPTVARLAMAEGNVYRVAGRLEEARTAFADAVERMEARAPAGDLAEAHHTLGLAMMSLGNAAEAERHFTRELALDEAALGPLHPDVGRVHQSLGATLYTSGQLGRALPHLEEAVRIFEAALGPMHPRVAASLSNLGALRDDLGEPEEAREHFERALLILEAAEGTGSTELVGLLGNLAQALRHAGDPAAAAPHLRRAAALIESTHGPGHPERVDLLTRLGEVLIEAGEPTQAEVVLVEADGLRRALPSEAALVTADAARALARLRHRQGEHAQALPLLSEAIELYRSQGPVLDPRRGETLLDLGEVLLAVDPPAARVPLEAAQPLLTTPQLPAATLARARFALARALMVDRPSASERTRARRLAEDARAGLPEDDPRQPEVSAWLTALPED
jgi:tetratricopeptide (TPR) repeat protein/predicted Ser/Thr protein kinase